ncbi:MAG TPA: ribose 5-phosphate isomerase B [Planctomycetota bacterium]|jgi:RpiB/LacA/LacB family sugar-phosphate isomerase|nr:ribose 5-phosphate isomerase B [Planctomycetota bacterium]
MKIALGADHAGWAAKESLGEFLRARGHEVIDLGPSSGAPCDYPDFAAAVARAVASGRADRGVLVCGTGVGMSIAANKIPGVRAVHVTDEATAEFSRRHNDANVFCAGARLLPADRIAELLARWLETPFEGGRHAGRLEKVRRLEGGPGPADYFHPART